MPFKSPNRLVALLVLVSAHLVAQVTSGNISGTVYDPSGAVVPAATVVVRNSATGVTNTSLTSSSGEYRVPNLLPGSYSVVVSASGFSPAEVRAVNIPLNETVTLNVAVRMAAASAAVSVTTEVAAIDTTTAQLQSTYEARQMTDLPMAGVGAGVINLSLLGAGVATSGGVGEGVGPSVGGQRPTNNNFTIEGVDVNNRTTTGPVVLVPNDAVAEFTVLGNQFSPEFGHSSGGQFNQIIKSGSNEIHGSLYEYFANRDLLAADNLSVVQGTPLHPRYDNNRFGGTAGGPIRRNRMFWFVNYEFNPIGGTNGTEYDAPTAAGYNMVATLPGVNQNNVAQFRTYLGTAPAASGTVTVGPGNESLETGAWQSGTGLTSIPVGEISTSLPSYTNAEHAVAAFDYNISDQDSLRARFILNRSGTIDTGGYPAAFFTTIPLNSYVATVSEYHVFTPDILNELRLGYNRLYQNYSVTDQQFPGLSAFPNIDVYELNAGFGPDPFAPQYGTQNTWTLSDNMSWTHGSHAVKFGFDGWRSISPQVFLNRARGDYEWSYFSDYIYDNNPDAIAQRSFGDGGFYGNQFLFGFFVNDAWKLRPNLTVNLGLRYEYETVPTTDQEQSVNAIASVPGLITFGTPKPQTTDFMPRIGLAWSPGTGGRTAIRAGFGINYDVLFDDLGILSRAPEFSTTVDVTGLNQSGFLAGGGIVSPVTGPLTAETARSETSGYIPDQRRPESIQWNLGIERAFGSGYAFESRYLGDRGVYLPVQMQLNRQAVVTAANALPVYLTAPSQAALNALPSTLGALNATFNNGGFIPQPWLDTGFDAPITAFMPVGTSTYNGWANQLTRRFSEGLSLIGAYTWSHDIDNATPVAASTVLTPRRPEDSQNLALDRSDSALDHRQRLTASLVYDLPAFRHGNWWMKNLVGNWELAPVYAYQTGTLVTAQSGVDSNLNADSWDDRVFVNPAGAANVGSGVTPLENSNGDVVAYLATNPNARYIEAPKGTLPNAGRNLLHLNPIDDIDLTAARKVAIGERFNVEFAARAFNVFNHPQYTGGYLSDVSPFEYIPGTQSAIIARNTLIPGNAAFENWSEGFSSNPRSVMLSLKLTF